MNLPQTQLSPEAIAKRARLYRAIMTMLAEQQVAPTDASSVCLYAAAAVAKHGIGLSGERFLDSAQEIWLDVERQSFGGLVS